jgi:reactive intermediate/imine deaminase
MKKLAVLRAAVSIKEPIMTIKHGIKLALVFVALTGLAACTDTSKTIHTTDAVYPAVGPYSQIVQTGNLYFLSGVIPLSEAGDAVQGASIEDQTRQVLNYITAKLQAIGMDLNNVVMSTVYMTDLDEFAQMNQIYGEYFSQQPPARATVEVSRLPRDVKIEIAVVASK